MVLLVVPGIIGDAGKFLERLGEKYNEIIS
jgi:hypothetical protein